MPPLPAISSGPNSRSRTTPMTSSVPLGAIAWTTTCGSPVAAVISSYAVATCTAFARPTRTPPISVLCTTPGAAVFSATG